MSQCCWCCTIHILTITKKCEVLLFTYAQSLQFTNKKMIGLYYLQSKCETEAEQYEHVCVYACVRVCVRACACVYVCIQSIYLATDSGTLSNRFTSSVQPSSRQPLTSCNNATASASSIPDSRKSSLHKLSNQNSW